MICVHIVDKPNIVQVKKKETKRKEKVMGNSGCNMMCLLNTCKACSGQDRTMRNNYGIKKT